VLRAGVVFGLVLVVAAAVLGGMLIYGLVLAVTAWLASRRTGLPAAGRDRRLWAVPPPNRDP